MSILGAAVGTLEFVTKHYLEFVRQGDSLLQGIKKVESVQKSSRQLAKLLYSVSLPFTLGPRCLLFQLSVVYAADSHLLLYDFTMIKDTHVAVTREL